MVKDAVIEFLKSHSSSSSSEIFKEVEVGSLATLKRVLSKLVKEGLVVTYGKGRATKYNVSASYSMIVPIDMDEYYSKEIDEREILKGFNFELFDTLLSNLSLFSEDESKNLEALQEKFLSNISTMSNTEYQKEIERLAIDLSWKSSQIEGNTYSLLETEKLLKEKQTASGKTKDEATMLLNHKEAIDFVVENRDFMRDLSVDKIEFLHSILIKELGIDKNIRKRKVGITGTNYTPIDNEFQIKEAMQKMCEVVNPKQNIFEKALLSLVILSYIQPFIDGNKRTARIVSNAILLANNHCPISFRTVDSLEYKKAMLLFYEQNNISNVKKIFIEQYKFAVGSYF